MFDDREVTGNHLNQCLSDEQKRVMLTKLREVKVNIDQGLSQEAIISLDELEALIKRAGRSERSSTMAASEDTT